MTLLRMMWFLPIQTLTILQWWLIKYL